MASPNSEQVEIVTRDRNNPGLIVKVDSAARFSDYEFEPFTGHILFKGPVPSVDENLNPIFIRITYEVDQGGQKFWTYGADGQVKVTNHFELGGAFAREENPLDKYGLYSADAVLALNQHSYLIGEVARSEDELLGSGNAWRLELRHTDPRLTARVFYGVADPLLQEPQRAALRRPYRGRRAGAVSAQPEDQGAPAGHRFRVEGLRHQSRRARRASSRPLPKASSSSSMAAIANRPPATAQA